MIKFNKFNNIKYSHKKIIIIIIVYLIFSYLFKGYFPYYPSIPVYPNNYKEAEKVKTYIKKRTKEDVNFFHLTNESIVTVFLPHVKETKQELYDIVLSDKCETIVMTNKYLINRARPEQVDSSIKPIEGDSYLAFAKRSLTLLAPTPTNNSTNSDAAIEKKGTPASPAIAFANKVLPVPGGPTSKTPLGIVAPNLV